MHQKHPPANVATAWPGGTTGCAAAAASDSKAAAIAGRRFIGSPWKKWLPLVGTTRGILRSFPQPCGAASSRGVAVHGRDEPRADLVGEYPLVPERGDAFIEPRNPGQSATQHDHAGIEHVDDRGERAREALAVALDRGRTGRIPGGGAPRDLFGGEALAARAGVVRGQPRAREVGLDARAPPAIA